MNLSGEIFFENKGPLMINLKFFISIFILILPVATFAKPNITKYSTLIGLSEESRRKYGKNTIVAIIDSGINVSHKEFKGQLWTNINEIPDNGIDDDRNGFTDDLMGWNFVDNNNDLKDRDGHGTSSAGLIAGIHSGVSPNSKMMILKVFEDGRAGHLNVLKALRYAIENSADVINLSAGFGEETQALLELIKLADSKGILIIVAAGNRRQSCSEGQATLALLNLNNTIYVGATDLSLSPQLTSYSNYGMCVDIAAPAGNVGEGLDAPNANDNIGYRLYNGTSAAAPLVSGVVAQLQSLNKANSAKEIKDAILNGGESLESLKEVIKSGRVVNLEHAIRILR